MTGAGSSVETPSFHTPATNDLALVTATVPVPQLRSPICPPWQYYVWMLFQPVPPRPFMNLVM